MAAQQRRNGRLGTLASLLLGSVALAAGLTVALLAIQPRSAGGVPRLIVYCAAGIREPVEHIAAQYQQEYSIAVELRYGGSSNLLAQIEINKFEQPDLFIAGDDYYTKLVREKGLAGELLPAAAMHAVLACRKDRPVSVATLDELLRSKLRLSAPNPDEAALGRVLHETLSAIPHGNSNRWEQFEHHVRRDGVFKPTVPEVATDIKAGTVDAGIVWDATVSSPHLRDNLMAVHLSELDARPSTVTVAVLYSSSQPTAALKFARYLTARDKGSPVLADCGLTPVEGDAWAERPSLRFSCGSLNRRAVEGIVEKFRRREGVDIHLSFDGSGIPADICIASDVSSLDNLRQRIQEAAEVSDKGASDHSVRTVTIARSGPYKSLVRRLLKRIADSPEAFQNTGIHDR